eukprot:CAMPEP_0204822234 /NCGR_PEP_ID=MMETSP1346-20131115/424_1 /ASSEMBLY_ACC=CAM_ASM_000771 /TAXON_ID=215587 /ORGANISM="Aplanochytrium stocchinoi, Strain GSBS06" /LENGTH=258 /DNA_ID=CAMNT_0051948327 /DNA_START=366 /DNA_END=1142 /DNA_ORIENTATION=-
MTNILYRAAEELRYEPRAVIILDDFNYCVGQCEKMLKELLLSHTLTTEKGEKVSAQDATIILTSDLTYMGLEIERGETYENALGLVEKAALEHWGANSLIHSASVLIPFAPLSDAEIIKVVDRMMKLTGSSIRHRINHELALLEKKNVGQSYSWTGSFVCSERTKMQIVDHMHDTIERKNSRAVTEELKALIRRLLKEPVQIEKRLIMLSAKPVGNRNSLFATKGFYYDQDITLEFNQKDPVRLFLRFIIDEEENLWS